MTEATESTVELVKHGRRETARHLLTADNLSLRSGPEGELVLELFRHASEKPVESYRLTLGAEDRGRLKKELDRLGTHS